AEDKAGHNAQREEHGHQRRTAIAEEGEGQADHRHDTHTHTDVDEDLNGEHTGNAGADQIAEAVVTLAGVIKQTKHHGAQQHNDHTAVPKVKLLSDHRKDVVVVFGGKDVVLGLPSLHIAGAEKLPGP